MSLGVNLTGGTVSTKGTIGVGMGDGTDLIRASNVLDDYSFVLLDGTEQSDGILFRCSTGLGPSNSDTNDVIGDISYNNIRLRDGVCSGLIQAEGTQNVLIQTGAYQACVCGVITTSVEGVYTCILTNSSMMNQSVSIGVYFSGRSESLYV